MLNIVNKGYIEILRLFYEKKESMHLRYVSKELNLNENSVFRFLNKLEDENVLSSEKKGNMKFFSLKKNKDVWSIFTFFDVKKYDCLPLIRRRAIDVFLGSLEKYPVFVILFGSTAKNTFAKDSDIDLLIISNEKMNFEKSIEYAFAQSGIKISVFQMRYSNFIDELRLRKDMVVQSALKTGYPLINHIKYYEVISDAGI